MVVKLKILSPDGAAMSAKLTANGQIVGLGIDDSSGHSQTGYQASLGFIRDHQNSGYFYHGEWLQNGTYRYFVHSQPYEQLHATSSSLSGTLYCAEYDGFRQLSIDLHGGFLQQTRFAPEAVVGMIYGGLKTYARIHQAHPTEPLELTLNLGKHSPILLAMLMADLRRLDQAEANRNENSLVDLPIQPMAHRLFREDEILSRNSPTMHTFLSVVDGVVYCDPVTARVLRGARGSQGSDEAVGNNLVADFQRAGRTSPQATSETHDDQVYPADVVDNFNAQQWDTLLRKISRERLTFYSDMSIGNASTQLAQWLAPQLGFEWVALRRFINEIFHGSIEANLHFDKHGFIVGAFIKRNEANAARGIGTTYEIGNIDTPISAKDIWLANLHGTDNAFQYSPISYAWRGEKGNAYATFKRWFNKPEFEAVRRSSITHLAFNVAMSEQPSIAARLAALEEIISSNMQLRKYFVDYFCNLTANADGGFERFLRDIREAVQSGEDLRPAHRLMMLCMELCLRHVVGNELVDQTINRRR